MLLIYSIFRKEKSEATSMRVLIFNIHHGKGMDRKLDLSRIKDVIQSSQADIIGLNEVDQAFSKRSQFVNQAMWLADELNMNYRFGSTISIQKKKNSTAREYGNALLTRFPIVSSRNHKFDFLPRLVEARGLLEVDVQVNNSALSCFVTHLSFTPLQHLKQSTYIIEEVKKKRNPTIVMGDWNMKPYSASWREVSSYLIDVNNGQGHNHTFPSNRPFMKLDYIFVSKELKVVSAKALKTDILASDHLPYLAEIEIKNKKSTPWVQTE